ncbi:RHS repeat protein [Agrobacterium tumefaciens]|nr:RHS repeat protein [Agrobacterium tumefaciens]NTE18187.1 RHS repeat protein [Agrobacterium tumefaciens]
MNIIQPSPTAANLGKYGDIPVTYYTGQANVSLPIFNIDGDDISLPISLSYNYTGLRPNEQIGWMGMGWSLQAGGVITVNVRGIPDGSAQSGKNYDEIIDSLTKATAVNQSILSETVQQATYDLEPDLYSFNFGNYSGKFIKFKGKFYCFPANKLKIQGAGDTGFIITTEEGKRYEFYASEITKQKATPGTPTFINYVSSWYLTRITNASQTEEIRLNYQQEGTLSQLGGFSQSFLKYEEIGIPSGAGPDPKNQLYPITADMGTRVECLRLTSILSDRYQVIFDPESTPREDISFAPAAFYALKGIRIKNKSGDLIKNIAFQHDYFGSGLSKYLKLSALKEYNVTSSGESTIASDAQIHVFDYEDGAFPIKGQPTGIDHYGYYNGIISSNLIPEKVIQGNVEIPIMPGGANREPSILYSKTGALNKITYPTGGYSEFIYESNQIETGNFLSVNHKNSLVINRNSSNEFEEIDSLKTFHLDGDQQINIWYARIGKAPISMDSIARENKKSEVFIYRVENGIETLVYTAAPYKSAIGSGQSVNLNLLAGDYIYRVHCDETENRIDVSISYNTQTSVPNLINAHGIRVKKIINHPLIGAPITKTFIYSGGKGLLPTYKNSPMAVYFTVIVTGYYRWLAHTLITSSIAEGQDIGTPYFYSTVIEERSAPGEAEQRTRYDYRDFNSDISYAGIKLIKKIDYKFLNGSFAPLSKTEYNYNVDVNNYFRAVKPPYKNTIGEPYYLTNYEYDSYQLLSGWDQVKSIIQTAYDRDSIKLYSKNFYDDKTHNLIYTIKNRSDGSEFFEKYKYASSYSLPAEIAMATANIDAKVETQVWKKNSLTDSVLVSGSITQFDPQTFKPVNIYEISVQPRISIFNNEFLDGQGKYTTLISDSRYENKASYLFDNYGKLKRQQQASGIPISYHYGYEALDPVGSNFSGKKNHPVAECKNAGYDEFMSENFEDDILEYSGGAHTGQRYHRGDYIVNWVVPNQRSYVISYWYHSGDKWLMREEPYLGAGMTLTGNLGYDDIRVYPSDAEMTTYTYKTGVGVTSVTDVNGLVTYYEYDNFNRLLNIKDYNGYILKNYTYKYMSRASVWSDTNAYCQTDQSGNNTGEQRMVQTDSNPLSSSYGLTRNVSMGYNGTCPTNVYAKMVVESMIVDYSYGYDVTISRYRAHLFNNAECTIPYVASNTMSINCKVFYTNEYDNGDPTTTQDQINLLTIPIGTSSSDYVDVISGCSPPVAARSSLKVAASANVSKALNQQKVSYNSGKLQANKEEDPGGEEEPKPATTCTSFRISVEVGTGYIPVN